jgi:hypothetical protein
MMVGTINQILNQSLKRITQKNSKIQKEIQFKLGISRSKTKKKHQIDNNYFPLQGSPASR